jgi:hypothetical protein
MSAAKRTLTAQPLIAAGLPLAALALSLLMVYPGWGRYNDLKAHIEQQRRQLRDLQTAPPLPPPGATVPAAADVPSEPADFLGNIAAIARASGCEFAGLEADTEPPGKAEGPLRPIRARITLQGDYPHIRYFLVNLARARRLYAVTHVEITSPQAAKKEGLSSARLNAILIIERYVVPRPPAATPSGPAAR